MKHTVYKNVKRDGDVLTLRTNGAEGKVEIRLSSVRKVKFPFASVMIETDEMTYRLDLRNVEPCEYAEVKTILTDAIKTRHRAANNTPDGKGGEKGSGGDGRSRMKGSPNRYVIFFVNLPALLVLMCWLWSWTLDAHVSKATEQLINRGLKCIFACIPLIIFGICYISVHKMRLPGKIALLVFNGLVLAWSTLVALWCYLLATTRMF
jgi:hypothetical protein